MKDKKAAFLECGHMIAMPESCAARLGLRWLEITGCSRPLRRRRGE